jgi:hypothetical protein
VHLEGSWKTKKHLTIFSRLATIFVFRVFLSFQNAYQVTSLDDFELQQCWQKGRLIPQGDKRGLDVRRALLACTYYPSGVDCCMNQLLGGNRSIEEYNFPRSMAHPLTQE